jgi:hypothetical protein
MPALGGCDRDDRPEQDEREAQRPRGSSLQDEESTQGSAEKHGQHGQDAAGRGRTRAVRQIRREADSEKPGSPASANPMKTTLPVMLATKTLPRPRMLAPRPSTLRPSD